VNAFDLKARLVAVFRGLVALVTALSLLTALFLIDIEAVAHHIGAYRDSFVSTGAPSRTGFSVDELTVIIVRVLDYSTGRRDDLQFDRADLDGGPPGRPAFTQRELDHMKDVRGLFVRARTAAWMALITAAAGASFLVLRGGRRGVALLARAVLVAAVTCMALWGALSAVVVADFGGFWTRFHLTLFSNKLWLLPLDSLLIQMLPQELFQRLSLEILGLFTVEVLATAVLAVVVLRRPALP